MKKISKILTELLNLNLKGAVKIAVCKCSCWKGPLGLLVGLLIFSGNSLAHEHHAKHGFILYGHGEIYASHKIYKDPHHFQVILALDLPEDARGRYLWAKNSYRDNLILFVLDPIDLASVSSASELVGTIYREDQGHNKFEVAPNVRLTSKQFRVLYFNELPLSLSGDVTHD